VPAQEKLSPTEQLLAYLIGAGVLIAVVAFFANVIGVANKDLTLSLLLVALALIVVGIGAWLYLLQPWKNFDDLTTPHYTGHDDHAHDKTEAAAAKVVAAPEPAPKAAAKAPAPKPEPKPAPKAEEKAPAPKPKPEPVAEEKAPAPKAAKKAPAPKPAPEPVKSGEPDDLTVIEGVGKKSAEALVASGIATFAQMAAKSPAELEEAVKSQKVRLVGSTETWPMQAELAAKGDMDALENLKKRIVKGVLQDE
jgi:predicted flap endonuclease-1-like 5' DNA nuclease